MSFIFSLFRPAILFGSLFSSSLLLRISSKPYFIRTSDSFFILFIFSSSLNLIVSDLLFLPSFAFSVSSAISSSSNSSIPNLSFHCKTDPVIFLKPGQKHLSLFILFYFLNFSLNLATSSLILLSASSNLSFKFASTSSTFIFSLSFSSFAFFLNSS